MEIFISWSGLKSKAAASAIREWIQDVFQGVKPWMSESDIDPGKRWLNELQSKLNTFSSGIICVTRQNLNAPWILFETGCIAKKIDAPFVIPVLLDLTPSDLGRSPLSMFMSLSINEEDILSLVSTINKSLPAERKIPEVRLRKIFDKWWPDLEKKLKNLPDDELSDYCDDEYSRNLRDFICYHQGKLIEYLFLAGEHHKELKSLLNNKGNDVGAISEKHDQLINHLNEYFGDIVSKSFDEIQKMYSGRNKYAPRICLKVNYGEKQKKIVALFRQKRVNYDSDCKVEENSGFNFIKENGVYYLCQDIPEAARKKEYINPRLILDKVINYFPSPSGNDEIDNNWVACWCGDKSNISTTVTQYFRNCYKSTLIIPLTLWNNKLVNKFIKKFRMEDVDRTIFGYLCVDHINTNYFDPICDVNSGYVFADILSLYLLIRFVYVDQSETYASAAKLLKQQRIGV